MNGVWWSGWVAGAVSGVMAGRLFFPRNVTSARHEAALKKIAKNNTDDCEIYTMGCDCHEEAQAALKRSTVE